MDSSTREPDADHDPQPPQHPWVGEPRPAEDPRQTAGTHEDPIEEPGYGHGV